MLSKMSDKTTGSKRQKVDIKQVSHSRTKKKKILGAKVQNLVASETWHLAFVHAWSTTLIMSALQLLFVISPYRRYLDVNRKEAIGTVSSIFLKILRYLMLNIADQ